MGVGPRGPTSARPTRAQAHKGRAHEGPREAHKSPAHKGAGRPTRAQPTGAQGGPQGPGPQGPSKRPKRVLDNIYICTCIYRKSLFLLQVLANIHYVALWIHHIIHEHLMCCSRSNVVFTCSLSCKSIMFNCSFKNQQHAKATLLKNDKDYLPNGSTWASEVTSQNHVSGIIV